MITDDISPLGGYAGLWLDRRVKIGYETAEELAKHYNPLNFRGHPENQRDATEESLDALGYVGQVKKSLHSGVILDGHLRIEIALAKDPAIQLPVDYYDLTPDEELLALQVLDTTTEMAQPIADKLAALMERTKHLTADKPGLAAMLEALKVRAGVNGNGHTPPELPPMVDKAEELQKKWQVQPGQVWQIDRHFVICGDCREVDTWARLLDAAGVEKVNGVFTSPPYAEQRKAQYGGVPTSEYVEWWGAVQTNVRAALAEDGSFFVNIKPHTEEGERSLYVMDLVIAMARQWAWSFVDEFCWLRSGVPREVKYSFKNGFEPVYQFALTRMGFKFRPDDVRHVSDSVPVPGGPGVGNTNWAGKQGHKPEYGKAASDPVGHSSWIFGGQSYAPGMAYPSNVLKSFSNDETRAHEAAFPVQLPTFFIKAYSDSGDVWLDPFCGSGTVLAACHNENRQGLGIEKLEKYCAVILERLATLTHQQPRLISG